MSWFLQAIRHKYATFEGRAGRKEYWFFVLYYCIAYFALMVVDEALGTMNEAAGVGLLSALFALATLLPAAAVTVRRLHDTDRSGWWILIGLVPLVGDLVLIVFAAQDSRPGANPYGPNPKEPAASAATPQT